MLNKIEKIVTTMLNAIIRFSLNNRLLVTALAALILVLGGMALRSLPVDVFPDLNRPVVTIMTEAPGMAPEEVEALVSMPLETQLNGLPGVERVRSSSGIGLSVVYVEFGWGTEIYRNRQLVAEKLSQVQERMPSGITPVLAPVSSIMGQIMAIAVAAPEGTLNPIELRTLADWQIRPRLMAIPGVAQVINIGGGVRQIQIQLDATALQRFQLNPDDVAEGLGHLTRNTTGGFLEKDGKELLVRNMSAAQSTEDLANTVVGLHLGQPVLLKQVATVAEAARVKRGDGGFNGKPAVIMTIEKQPGADTLAITKAVQAAVAELKPALPPEVVVNADIFKQATFIETAIANVKLSLEHGTILVALVLIVFLMNLRTTAITLTAIPLSFLVAALVFWLLGLSVNTMTLGGLAIAIGELVDDAIVDVENVFRRLRENRALAKPLPVVQVVYRASSEIRNSIVLATGIVVLVFLPLFSLTGIEGRLFMPLGIAYIVALLASLLVSLTVTPVLCSYLLGKGQMDKHGAEHADTWLVRGLKRGNSTLVRWVLQRPLLPAALVGVVLVGVATLIPNIGRDFLPKFNEGTAMISLIATPGISLNESNEIGRKAEQILQGIPEIKWVSRRVGRAELDEHAEGVNVTEVDVDFKEGGRPRPVVLEDIRKKLEVLEVGVGVGQPISHRIDHMMSGVQAQIAIKVFGPELSRLRAVAGQIERAIKDIPGLADVRVEQQRLVPQVKVHFLRDKAAQYGLSVGELADTLEMAFNGNTLGVLLERGVGTDVVLRFGEHADNNLEVLRQTPIKVMPDGTTIRLGDVADVYETQGPNQVNRENGKRRIVVSANATNDIASVVEALQARITDQVKLPEGYFIIYDGQYESQQRATQHMLMLGLAALLGIALLLYSQFRSLTLMGLVMACIPLALMGGVAGLFLSGQTFNMASLVGFVTLCGIASRNGIMLISHYLHLLREEGETFGKAMIVRGANERLVPVLMTATTAIIALLPLALSVDVPGREILQPVALVIVSGLVSSTLISLILMPALFFRFGKQAAQKLHEAIPEKLTRSH